MTFTPTNGTPYSVGSQVGGDIISAGNVTSYNHTVSANSTYYYALYTYDGSEYSIVASTNTVTTGDECSDLAGEWIRVPGNPAYEANDFCVMKYEAKCSNANGQSCPSTDTPTSTIAGTPWVEINQTEAIDACDDIPGAQLITNDQWMTIATNIANQGNNWQGGTVGTNSLNRGNSDGSVQEVSDDSNACDGTSAGSCTPTSGWHINRRTHTLSNGEVIWDMAGNAWEWTSDDGRASGKASPGFSFKEFDTISGGTQLKTDFIPQVAIDSSWNSAQGIGQYYPGSDNSGGALRRGARWLDGTYAGVFAAAMDFVSSDSNIYTGFRCVRL